MAKHAILKKDNVLLLAGEGSDHEKISGQIRYQIQTSIQNRDGNVTVDNNKISVSNATEALIYISTGTNCIDYEIVRDAQTERASAKLEKAVKKDYRSAIKEHSAIDSKQFNRFKLYLGNQPEASGMTTTQRITAFKDNQNPALVTLLVQFGRYLLIFSSQSVGQPANLQSI